MFARPFVLIGAAAVFATVSSADVKAGHGHHKRVDVKHHRAAVCYKRVHTPAVWKTVKIKRTGRSHCTRVVHPAVYKTEKQQVVVRRERWRRHHTRAVYKTETYTEVVRPAYTRWRHVRMRGTPITVTRKGHHGRVHHRVRRTWVHKKVAVHVPARVRARTRHVLVTPAKRWKEKIPAVLGWREHRVRVKHRTVERICKPPVETWIERKVRVKHGHWTRVKTSC